MSYATLDYAFRDINYLLTAAMVIIMLVMFAVLVSTDIPSALFGDDEKRRNVSRFKSLIGGVALIAVILLVENGLDLLSGRILADYRADRAAMQEQAKAEYRLAGLTGAQPPAKALQAIGVDDTGTNNIVDALKSVGFTTLCNKTKTARLFSRAVLREYAMRFRFYRADVAMRDTTCLYYSLRSREKSKIYTVEGSD